MKIPEDMLAGTLYSSNGYGDFTIVKYLGWDSVLVEFTATKFRIVKEAAAIRKGQVRDPFHPITYSTGFMGTGKYATKDKEHKRIYTIWSAMLGRCYGGTDPAYSDCEVCLEWHNFQNYAQWYEDNCIEGYEVDKDIKVQDNMVYSPSTCIFVTQEENVKHSKLPKSTYVLLSPTGERFYFNNQKEFSEEHGLPRSHVSKLLRGLTKQHKGWTLP